MGSFCALFNWIGVQDTFRALGIEFSTNLNTMVRVNYDKVIISVKCLIEQWSKRNLTVLGRVTIVKSLLLSKLTFLILTLPDPPGYMIKELDSMFYKFIWKGVDRISRNQMRFENGRYAFLHQCTQNYLDS